ncbi:MAG: hypothetical protein FWC11_01075 [Firmicutes bacterium]|nr:hypothetical protein [Bacillota bacterium]
MQRNHNEYMSKLTARQFFQSNENPPKEKKKKKPKVFGTLSLVFSLVGIPVLGLGVGIFIGSLTGIREGFGLQAQTILGLIPILFLFFLFYIFVYIGIFVGGVFLFLGIVFPTMSIITGILQLKVMKEKNKRTVTGLIIAPIVAAIFIIAIVLVSIYII